MIAAWLNLDAVGNLEGLDQTLTSRVDVVLHAIAAAQRPVDRRHRTSIALPSAGRIGGHRWTEFVCELAERPAGEPGFVLDAAVDEIDARPRHESERRIEVPADAFAVSCTSHSSFG